MNRRGFPSVSVKRAAVGCFYTGLRLLPRDAIIAAAAAAAGDDDDDDGVGDVSREINARRVAG